MRILKLQFTNLNSLAGTWQVDFTDPAYRHGGIFAITGPTGAGKSTILDAICLALYGCTPRLKSISISENEAMTRLTAVCSSEVTFQTQAGVFRCTWSQRRAHGKPDGNLQQPRHEIADAATGAIIESQIRRVAGKIVEVTGMDLDQFTRSMLLAQGRFATFLFADANDRGPVLEQITGTGIYSKISVYVYERCQAEKKELEKIGMELAALAVLSEEECARLRGEQKTLNARSSELALRIRELMAAQAWRETISKLEEDAAGADAQYESFSARSADAESDRERLARADQASALEAHYAPLLKVRAEFAQLKESLSAAAGRRPAAEAAHTDAQSRLQESRMRREELGMMLQQESAQWKKVRDLDTTIREKRKAFRELEKLRDEHRRELEKQNEKRSGLSAALEAVKAEKEQLQKFFEAHANDATLPASFGAIEVMIRSIQAGDAKLEEKRARLQAAGDEAARYAADAEQARVDCERNGQEARTAASGATESEAEVERILRGRDAAAIRSFAAGLAVRERTLEEALRVLHEISSAREALKAYGEKRTHLDGRLEKGRLHAAQAEAEKEEKQREVARCEELVLLLRTIDSLTEHRAHLQDGQPCPLCGSTEHPYASGQIPRTDEKTAALARAKSDLEAVSLRLQKYAAELARIESDLANLASLTAEKENQIASWQSSASGACAGLGIACELETVAEEAETVRAQKQEADRHVLAADAAIEERDRSRKEADEAQKRSHASQIRYEQASSRFGKSDESRRNLELECAAAAEEIDASLGSLQDRCAEYGIGVLGIAALASAGEALRSRRDTWEERSRTRDGADKREQEIVSDLRSVDAVLANVARQAEKGESDVRQADSECAALEKEREALYGAKDPDEEERAMNAAVAEADRVIAASAKQAEQCAGDLAVLDKEIGIVRERMDACEASLAEDEKQFAGRLAEAGFGGEDAFAGVRLGDAERAALQRRLDELRDEGTRLGSRREQKRTELQRERDKKITDASPAQIASTLKDAEASREDVQQRIGALENQLRRDEEQQSVRTEKAAEQERRRREYLRWDALNELIGSASGKKFQKIAQTVTFEMMVAQANKVLRKMSPRYFLICDPNTDLEMNIVDQYQAGEVRSTKNLSGGESFIVSLSLALGLSHMASRNVRVDSLFLDEGFGTLDEEALDVALTTLSELQQEGKTIGVISHVGALKERIAAQIVVTPETGGRSSLSGPGCRRIN